MPWSSFAGDPLLVVASWPGWQRALAASRAARPAAPGPAPRSRARLPRRVLLPGAALLRGAVPGGVHTRAPCQFRPARRGEAEPVVADLGVRGGPAQQATRLLKVTPAMAWALPTMARLRSFCDRSAVSARSHDRSSSTPVPALPPGAPHGARRRPSTWICLAHGARCSYGWRYPKSVRGEAGLPGRSRSPRDPSHERITWAMTLGGDVRFRWWLQRSGPDSF
jgi:hypothetical protein